MTTAVQTTPNGRDRKTLASQLDRLDGILDGLADALNESVAVAVQQAVSGVLTEILTNPTFTDRLRRPVDPLVENVPTDTRTPPPPPRDSLLTRVTGTFRSGCEHVQRACGDVLRHAASLAGSGRSYVSSLFCGRLLPLAGVIVTAGIVIYLAGPQLPLLVTGAAGWLATMFTRARSSLRRSPTVSSFQ